MESPPRLHSLLRIFSPLLGGPLFLHPPPKKDDLLRFFFSGVFTDGYRPSVLGLVAIDLFGPQETPSSVGEPLSPPRESSNRSPLAPPPLPSRPSDIYPPVVVERDDRVAHIALPPLCRMTFHAPILYRETLPLLRIRLVCDFLWEIPTVSHTFSPPSPLRLIIYSLLTPRRS